MAHWCLVFIQVLALCSVATYVVFGPPKGDLNREGDLPDGDAFINVSHGRTRFSIRGSSSDNAPRAVLIHGFLSPKEVFNRISSVLIEEGYQVLTYDLYGRGYSTAPDVPMSESLYVSQVAEVIIATGFASQDRPADVMGLSMGGAIATSFASTYPQLVKSVTLLSPAGLKVDIPLTAKLMQVPYINYIVMRLRGTEIVKQKAKNTDWEDFGSPEQQAFSNKFLRILDEQLTLHPGYARTLVSTLEHFPMSDVIHRFRKLGEHGTPTLFVWGTNDETCIFPGETSIKSVVPQAKVAIIKGGTHNIVAQRFEEVSAHIVSFVRGLSSSPSASAGSTKTSAGTTAPSGASSTPQTSTTSTPTTSTTTEARSEL